MADANKGSDDKDRQDDRLEALKIYFEMCKHMTTISVAVTVVVLTVYRDIGIKSDVFGVALALFGLSGIFSVLGMLNTAGRVERGAKAGLLTRLMVVSASGSFLVGLGMFMFYASNVSFWLTALFGLLFLGVVRYARRREREIEKEMAESESSEG